MNECNNETMHDLMTKLNNLSHKYEDNIDLAHSLRELAREVRSIDERSCLVYNSIFDEARSMAKTLCEIDSELRHAAQCEGDYDGGYPSKDLLPNLCKLMYKSMGYHNQEKYN